MQNNNPLVSVIMATYNEPKEYISKSINSILTQTYKNIELLILDDSSNSETINTINSFCYDQRVRVLRSETRMGFVPALNIGLQNAKGLYIARMDGDDISLPTRIEDEVNYLISHPDVSIVGSSISIIDENDSVTAIRKYPLSMRDVRRYSCFRCPVAHPTVMFTSKIIKDGFLYNEKLKKAEDLDLWLRLLNAGYKINNIDKVLLNYRVVGSLANKRSKSQWIANFNIRRHNFDIRYLGFSLKSIIVSFIYVLTPNSIFDLYYKRENKR